MKGLIAVFSLLSADPIEETNAPCFLTSFDYYTRITIAALAPLAITALIFVYCVFREATKKKKTRRRRNVASLAHAKHLGTTGTVVKAGLWRAAPLALPFIDFVQPVCTRTFLQFFSCRSLGEAGKWLEADCT